MTKPTGFKQKVLRQPIGKYLFITGAVLLLIIQFCIQIHLSKVDTETSDEGSHLNAAFSYIADGVFYYNPEHPALTKDLAGLAIQHLNVKTTPVMKTLLNNSSTFFYDSWSNNLTSASILTYEAGNNPDQLLFWGRLPFIFITLILGLSIFLIAYFEWGEVAAFAATAVYTLDPTITAHGHLMTTDIPVALGYLLTVYAAWKFLRRPNWLWASALGAAGALAFLCKYSAIIVIPTFVVFFFLAWALSKDWGYWKKVLPKLVLTIVVAIIFLWAGYGFHDRVAPPATSFTAEMSYTASHHGSLSGYIPPKTLTRDDKIYTAIRPALDLLPGDFVKGMYMVLEHSSNGQNEFFLGKNSTRGWWYYFPVILLLKLPIPTLILAGFAIFWIFWRKPTDWTANALLIGAGVFLAVAMTSKADLGIRYILPIFPILALVIGYGVSKLIKLKYLFYILFIWLVIIYIISYPNYLSYFNGFVGGTHNAYKVRSDSDVDWGQDLKRIGSYIKANHLNNVYLSYYWVGSDAVDYYLGPGIKPINLWKRGDGGTAIVGASMYNLNVEGNIIRNPNICTDLKEITPGVLTCKLR